MSNKEEIIGMYIKWGEYTISTIKPKYSNIYETAIMLNELGSWHIVEVYTTKKEATKGYE